MTHEQASECNHVRDDLSAWLDGRAADPARIEAHLTVCPDCARRRRELKAISDALKAMPAPAVSDDFALRVTARIRRPAARHYWPAASVMLAAAAVLVIMAAVVLSLRQPAPVLPAATRAADVPPAPETGLFAEILLGNDTPAWDYGFPVPADAPETSPDDLVLALSASGWFEDAAEAWEAETDLDELVQSLNEIEQTELKRLLRTYQEGAQI